MEIRKIQTEKIEHRALTSGLEIRKTDDGKMTLRGYAALFGSSYDMGWFTEEVHRNAFTAADMSDVRVLFNHDPNQVLGRTKSGTARVGVDERGLWYEVDLPESAAAVREAIQRGDVAESSWGFTLEKDEWERRDGKNHRVLTQVETVFDVSPVTFPANPETTVAKRSFDAANTEPDPEAKVKDQVAEMIDTEIEIALAERNRAKALFN